jgi:ubiquinone/menaquinone biosynthesis C-methylase UbiE
MDKIKVKEYWEQPTTVSIIDDNLHEIEINSVLNHLKSTDFIADIGCGEGKATHSYAQKVNKVLAIERSSTLRNKAIERNKSMANVLVEEGDVMSLDYKEKFDAVVTQRLLINLTSEEEQWKAIDKITKAIKPGGRFIMIENTNQCFRALNDLREKVDMKPIPQHWHNLFFDRGDLLNYMNKNYRLEKEYDYSLYYFLTRVYTQMFASFEGYGINAMKDDIFEKSDKAARIVYEKFKDNIKLDPKVSTIQCFVFEKKE